MAKKKRTTVAPTPAGCQVGIEIVATPAALAKMLAAIAPHVNRQRLAAHLRDGAPTTAEGEVNLIHYAAWLVREATHARPQGPAHQ